AIHSWVNNITKVMEGGQFSIREPERINYDLYEHIDPAWVIILTQFILHKRLNDEKIERIFADDFNSEIKQNIEKLLKGKILLKDQNGTMKISSYLQAHIEYKLNLMGVI
ncbi:MAG: hypothetical protein KAH48_02930, partial [Chlorobi bacterium]|nr:hypothetical protein [Chlorobiota bacterium]